MNSSSYRKSRQRLWIKTYKAELAKRKALYKEDYALYMDQFGPNLKPLTERCEGDHVWVPASILWIHDNGARSTQILGYFRRALYEGAIYKSEGYQIEPMICWNCCSGIKERIKKILSRDEKLTLAQEIQKDKKTKKSYRSSYKKRPRKQPKPIKDIPNVLPSIEELLEN